MFRFIGLCILQPMKRSLCTRIVIVAAGLMSSACVSCSANGGWERVFNPFCVRDDFASRPICVVVNADLIAGARTGQDVGS